MPEVYRISAGDSSIGRAGKDAEPLFGVDWEELWETPIDELRARFALDQTKPTGEGIRAAA